MSQFQCGRLEEYKPVWCQVTRLYLCLQILHLLVISDLEINWLIDWAPVTSGEDKFNFYMLAVIHDNASFWPHFQVHFILHLTLFCPRLWRKRKGSISFSAEILGNFVNLGKMCWFLKLTSHQGCPGRGVSVRVRVGDKGPKGGGVTRYSRQSLCGISKGE